MPITKVEITRGFSGKLVSSSEKITAPWSGEMIDRVSHKVRVTVFQATSERPDDVAEVTVGPYRDYLDPKTDTIEYTGDSPKVLVYRNKSISAMGCFLGKSLRERLIGFVWTPAQEETLTTE